MRSESCFKHGLCTVPHVPLYSTEPPNIDINLPESLSIHWLLVSLIFASACFRLRGHKLGRSVFFPNALSSDKSGWVDGGFLAISACILQWPSGNMGFFFPRNCFCLRVNILFLKRPKMSAQPSSK